jgi:hypothetical protein
MSIKHRRGPSETPAPDSLTEEFKGFWGEIAPANQSVYAIRFCRGQGDERESFSYPYHVLSKWHWTAGNPEILEVHAAGDSIRIEGRGLEKLMNALDVHRLIRVNDQSRNLWAKSGAIEVNCILLDSKTNVHDGGT